MYLGCLWRLGGTSDGVSCRGGGGWLFCRLNVGVGGMWRSNMVDRGDLFKTEGSIYLVLGLGSEMGLGFSGLGFGVWIGVLGGFINKGSIWL